VAGAPRWGLAADQRASIRAPALVGAALATLANRPSADAPAGEACQRSLERPSASAEADAEVFAFAEAVRLAGLAKAIAAAVMGSAAPSKAESVFGSATPLGGL
jgi:hypothetical protein